MITIQSTLAPDSAGTQVDNLAVSSNTLPVAGIFSFEPDLTNNDDTVSFTPGTVDVGINKSVVGPSTVGVGDVATFRFAISNSGTVAATNVVVTDTLPDGLEALDLPPGCQAAGQAVTCALATLPPASALTIDVNARADASAAGQTLTNRASIRSDEADLDAANDTSAADLTIGPLPTVDVGIEKTRVGSGEVPVGGEAVFRLVARNDGDAPGTGVEVRDSLPARPHPRRGRLGLHDQRPRRRLPDRHARARRRARLRGARASRALSGRPDLDQPRHRHGRRSRSRTRERRQRRHRSPSARRRPPAHHRRRPSRSARNASRHGASRSASANTAHGSSARPKSASRAAASPSCAAAPTTASSP